MGNEATPTISNEAEHDAEPQPIVDEMIKQLLKKPSSTIWTCPIKIMETISTLSQPALKGLKKMNESYCDPNGTKHSFCDKWYINTKE
ncbi:MAG: hypothetical protein WD425_11455 [Nitrospirales bacterium]